MKTVLRFMSIVSMIGFWGIVCGVIPQAPNEPSALRVLLLCASIAFSAKADVLELKEERNR